MTTDVVGMQIPGLIRSRERREILALFVQDPDKEYYQRELERRLGISVGNIRRELNRLQLEGLVESRRFGNLVLFKLNKRHPLYRDYRGIILKTAGVAFQIREALLPLKEKGLRLAMIFGSYAHAMAGVKGAHWSSERDVDLMFVTAGSGREVGRVLSSRKGLKGLRIEPVGYDVSEFEKRIGERHHFIQEVLSKPIIPLVGFGEEVELRPIRVDRRRLQGLIRGWKHEWRRVESTLR